MDTLLSTILGISVASGLNVYATVLGLGLLQRYGWVQLPGQLDVVGSAPVLIGAGIMYAVEFIADKVPYIDSMWDAVHTVIRPLAAAVLAYSAVGNVSTEWQILAALVGGSIALTSHTAKASARAAVNLSPEPFSNWLLSFGEDVIAFSLVWLVTFHPFVALIAAAVLIAGAVLIIAKLSHMIRRAWRRRAA